MKNFLLVLAILSFLFVQSQDILVFKTGEELKSRVLEVGISEVKYKKFENLEGAIYVCLKNDLFMIKFENGTKDVFANLSKPTPTDTNIIAIYNPAKAIKGSGDRITFLVISQLGKKMIKVQNGRTNKLAPSNS